MKYIPKTETITAFCYGSEQLPDWLVDICLAKAGRFGETMLVVKPINDPDLMIEHVVRLGEYLVLKPNGSIWHYTDKEQFLGLLFSTEQE